MSEKRRCDGCGKDYWWPAAKWQHEGCVLHSVDTACDAESVSGAPVNNEVERLPERLPERKQRWSKEAYNAYQREYMRKRRSKGGFT